MSLVACTKKESVEPTIPQPVTPPVVNPIVVTPLTIKDGYRLTVRRPYGVYNDYTIKINIFDSIISPYVDSILTVDGEFNSEIHTDSVDYVCYGQNIGVLYLMSELETAVFYIHKGAQIQVMSQTQKGETVGGIVLYVNDIPKYEALPTTTILPVKSTAPGKPSPPPIYVTHYQGDYIYN